MAGYPGLTLSEDGSRLIASVVPVAERPALDADALRALILGAGYADWFLLDAALVSLLLACQQGRECRDLAIGERRDGSFTLEVAPDATHVWLKIEPACGGKRIDSDEVFIALGAAGVTFGIDAPAITAACAANLAGRFEVARAVPAIDGEDGSFELLVSDARNRSPQVNDKGLIDFRDLGDIPTVTADQPLMRRRPPTRGKPGCNVRGGAILARDGASVAFADHLEGAYVDPADPDLLRATYSGQPVCGEKGVSVENVLRVRNVNMATGNIGFDGTVVVEGEVLPGMKVNATGDIIVASVVDGAMLNAGGDISIGGGAIAKANIRAGGAVTVRFVESAEIYAGTTLAVEDSALQADLQANNQILVGVKNPRGKLSGGSARAMLLIQAPVLGAATGGVTQLVLGVNPVLDAEYKALLQSIETRKEEEDKLDKLAKHLVKQGDKSGMLERVNASRQSVIQAWGKLLPEREALEKQLAQIADAQVQIGVEVAGAVDLGFGKKQLRLRRSLPAGTVSLQGDQFIFTDPGGTETPLV
ncbi:DUF342 domain-containing protein [Propionivibrio dicarboxylicus]|uniref:Flagellar Assembly Protein A N-terminal region domain-containing protein n=1 Tax=Propionivibrio dicarboxylicus TaxID=83767 RepID=A0A1G8C6X1_9RHOO|nr:FapA family protein [Propionivibrio dicarboxylicus]SDH40670.1 hypothetical protein SAMN05660652_01681 [Propionivibrio dicarboxylicus]